MLVGLTGDPMRGGKAIGLSVPTVLSATAIKEAVELNPDAHAFILTVNPFEKDRAQNTVRAWISAYRPKNTIFRVEVNPRSPQGAWLIEPLDDEGEK